MKECVVIDGVRSANARAHKEKGWFRNVRPEQLLIKVYQALFERNPKVKPEEVEAVFCGTANQAGMQNDIARIAWLAGGFPECVATNGINQQCPSGMAATEHAARAIMCGEGDIYIASGVEDMQKVPMMFAMDIAPTLLNRYRMEDLPMGATAESGPEGHGGHGLLEQQKGRRGPGYGKIQERDRPHRRRKGGRIQVHGRHGPVDPG
jgi:acetyl-CoA acetyltransferase